MSAAALRPLTSPLYSNRTSMKHSRGRLWPVSASASLLSAHRASLTNSLRITKDSDIVELKYSGSIYVEQRKITLRSWAPGCMPTSESALGILERVDPKKKLEEGGGGQ